MLPNEAGQGSRMRSRRSFAQMPRSNVGAGVDRGNTTSDMSGLKEGSQKRAKYDNARSKSLGPGGLDALEDDTKNRRKSTSQFPLKSILKPTVPVSPVRNIPSFEETRQQASERDSRQSISRNDGGLLIDFSTPPHVPVTGTNHLANPFVSLNPLSSNKLERNEADERAAREREEAEKREAEKEAILQQREARRKSLANRRVSFAPEATLHTWNVVEMMDDSTTSSTSNSTRRGSQLPRDQQASDSSPAEDTERLPDNRSQKTRRNSGVSLNNIEDDEIFSSSPYSSSSVGSDENADPEPVNGDDLNSDDDDSDPGDTVMSMENATERSPSIHSHSSTDSDARLDQSLHEPGTEADSRRIDYDENEDLSMEFTNQEIAGAFQPWLAKGERPELELDDLTSRFDQENVNPFEQPLNKPKLGATEEGGLLDSDENDDDGDMSMEMTKAVGEILERHTTRNTAAYQTSAAKSPEKSQQGNEASEPGEETMDMTMAGGGIQRESELGSSPFKVNEEEGGGDEEMTMELTSVLGGIMNKGRQWDDFESETNDGEEAEMEMTGAVGGILPPIEEQTEPPEEESAVDMTMTNAVGRILSPETPVQQKGQRERGKRLMEMEADSGQPVSPRASQKSLHRHSFSRASESGSPRPSTPKQISPAKQSERKTPERISPGRQSRHAMPHPISPVRHPERTTPERTSPVRHSRHSTPEATSPLRQSRQSRHTTPEKMSPVGRPTRSTPEQADIEMQDSTTPQSPRRLSIPSKQSTPHTSPSTPRTPRSASRVGLTPKTPPSNKRLFREDAQGQTTPTVVLQPPGQQRYGGAGLEKGGLGSSRVAEILDRRRSIGEEAQVFSPRDSRERQPAVRFDDPRQMEKEIEKEQERTREVHPSLKELIQSLTPRKKPRKSLHVGTAVGLLGKRPVELDMDDDEVDAHPSPKRFRGREASPVKNVRLPAPLTKADMAGNRTLFGSPAKPATSFQSPSKQDEESRSPSPEVEDTGDQFTPIKLQDFLEMTNIHFMELDTTKRRHTIAPKEKRTSSTSSEATFEDCVATGFCTIPMLELYQHSCRELKSYISEGRSVIHSIEDETYADNPPLFQEYVRAPPDVRLLMDNQFRNVKTHARLLSKEMWYEWRMRLLEGLKEGLDDHVEQMKVDDKAITKREELLNGVVPRLTDKHKKLDSEARALQRAADEFNKYDKEELRSARQRLVAVAADLTARKSQLAEWQALMQDRTAAVESGAARKAELQAQISEAEHVVEESRGWSVKEVRSLNASVSELECKTGWRILSAMQTAHGPILTMCYRGELQLSFSPKVFRQQQQQRPQSLRDSQHLKLPTLTYAPDDQQPLTPERALILHALRTRLAQLTNNTISTTINMSVRTFLAQIAHSWDTARHLAREIHLLKFCGLTRLDTVDAADAGDAATKGVGHPTSEINSKDSGDKRNVNGKSSSTSSTPTSLHVRCTLLGAPLAKPQQARSGDEAVVTGSAVAAKRARVDIDFWIAPRFVTGNEGDGDGGVEVDVSVAAGATPIYGIGIGNGAGIDTGPTGVKLEVGIGDKNGQGQDTGQGREQGRIGCGAWRDAVRQFGSRLMT